MRDNRVFFQLMGGLGNQLFIYFAGQYFQREVGFDVVYLNSKQSKGVFRQESSLFSFQIEHGANDDDLSRSGISLIRRFYQSGVPILGPLLKGLVKSHVYAPKDVGFDSSIRNIKSGQYVHGYFQTHKYVDSLFPQGIPALLLRKTSPWLGSMLYEMNLVKPIVVHVRRGDFRNLSNTMGLLAKEYYVAGLETLLSVLGDRPVWVFSDEIHEVKSEMHGWLPDSALFVEQPLSSNAAEGLVLMSQSQGMVMSNSTYSWWAAKLGVNKHVVTPEKWFRAWQDPIDLQPIDWVRVPSKWKD